METSNYVQSLRAQMRVYSAYRAAAGAVMAYELGFDIDRAWVGGAGSQFSPGRQGGVEIRRDDPNTALERGFILAAAARYTDSITMEMQDDCGWETLFTHQEKKVEQMFFFRVIDDKWSAVVAVAEALLERGSLTGAGLMCVMSAKHDV